MTTSVTATASTARLSSTRQHTFPVDMAIPAAPEQLEALRALGEAPALLGKWIYPGTFVREVPPQWALPPAITSFC